MSLLKTLQQLKPAEMPWSIGVVLCKFPGRAGGGLVTGKDQDPGVSLAVRWSGVAAHCPASSRRVQVVTAGGPGPWSRAQPGERLM